MTFKERKPRGERVLALEEGCLCQKCASSAPLELYEE